jgi:hypothetical protein
MLPLLMRRRGLDTYRNPELHAKHQAKVEAVKAWMAECGIKWAGESVNGEKNVQVRHNDD